MFTRAIHRLLPVAPGALITPAGQALLSGEANGIKKRVPANFSVRHKAVVARTANAPAPTKPPTLPFRRVYVERIFYKSKTALVMRPIQPTFRSVEGSDNLKLEREGSLFLEFAPASGMRQYDWSKKQIFALSATEMAEICDIDNMAQPIKFFHDPNKGREGEGDIYKSLEVGKSEKGYSLNLAVRNKRENTADNLFMSLSRSEFLVAKISMEFLIPHVIGWSMLARSLETEDFTNGNGNGNGSGDRGGMRGDYGQDY